MGVCSQLLTGVFGATPDSVAARMMGLHTMDGDWQVFVDGGIKESHLDLFCLLETITRLLKNIELHVLLWNIFGEDVIIEDGVTNLQEIYGNAIALDSVRAYSCQYSNNDRVTD